MPAPVQLALDPKSQDSPPPTVPSPQPVTVSVTLLVVRTREPSSAVTVKVYTPAGVAEVVLIVSVSAKGLVPTLTGLAGEKLFVTPVGVPPVKAGAESVIDCDPEPVDVIESAKVTFPAVPAVSVPVWAPELMPLRLRAASAALGVETTATSAAATRSRDDFGSRATDSNNFGMKTP